MSGLITPVQPPQAQPPVEAQPVNSPAPQIKPSTADGKADLERYINRATMLIHSPETRGAILNMLTNNDPVQRVAEASVMVMQRIDAASRQSGVEVQDTIKMYGVNAIVNLVVEFGNAAGKFKLTPDLAELALSVAVQDYIKGEVSAGRINAQRLKAKMDIDIRKMPPNKQQEIKDAQARVQMTARKYNGGKAQGDAPVAPEAPMTPPAEPPTEEVM